MAFERHRFIKTFLVFETINFATAFGQFAPLACAFRLHSLGSAPAGNVPWGIYALVPW